MTNSVDIGQLASEESTLFVKAEYIRIKQDKS